MRTIRLGLLSVVAAFCGVLTWICGVGPAQAAAAQLSIAPTAGPPGTRVTVTGTGFCPAPCAPVEVDFGGAPVLRAVTVAGSGTFRVSFTVPAGTPGGVNTVYAEQRDAASNVRDASTTFRITPSVPAPTGSPVRVPTPTTTARTPTRVPTKVVTTAPRVRSPTPTRTTSAPFSATPSTGLPTTPAGAAEADDGTGAGVSSGLGWGIAGAIVLVAAVAGAFWWRSRRPR